MKLWVPAFAGMTVMGCSAPIEPAALPPHPTIVSLNPCTDAILAEVTEPGQLLAISHYSHDPASTSMELDLARRYPATGGTVEEVLALRPDIVVASDFIAPATRNALMDLGIRVETVGIASTLAQSQTQVTRLARTSGQPAKGGALNARIARSVAKAAPRNKEPIATVLWQPAGIVAGEGALVNALLRHAGFASHSASMGLGQADYLPLERLLADPADLLLIAGQERGQHHPALARLRTAGDMAVMPFDPALLYCGGPTIIRAMDRLRAIREAI